MLVVEHAIRPGHFFKVRHLSIQKRSCQRAFPICSVVLPTVFGIVFNWVVQVPQGLPGIARHVFHGSVFKERCFECALFAPPFIHIRRACRSRPHHRNVSIRSNIQQGRLRAHNGPVRIVDQRMCSDIAGNCVRMILAVFLDCGAYLGQRLPVQLVLQLRGSVLSIRRGIRRPPIFSIMLPPLFLEIRRPAGVGVVFGFGNIHGVCACIQRMLNKRGQISPEIITG